MGHCHLYPLHSWQDILLTFAEMELDSTTMFPLGTSVMFYTEPVKEYPPPPRPCISYALVQATLGVGTVIILYAI